jgi:hypothetical protein
MPSTLPNEATRQPNDISIPGACRPGLGRPARAFSLTVAALATIVASACGHMGPEHSDPALFAWQGALKAPGSVTLRNVNGRVDVKPSDDDSVRITASARWHRGNPRTDIKFDIANVGGALTVCVIWNRGICSTADGASAGNIVNSILKMRGGTDATVQLTVFVPARVKLDISTLNGSVNVAASGPVKARSLNGTIRIATAIGPVDAESMNGNVDVRMTTLGEAGPVRSVTVNGTASAFLPEKLDATVALSASNGRIGTDYAVTTKGNLDAAAHELSGMIGAGGREVTVTTVNGSAWLRKLNADGTVAGAQAAGNP